MENQKNSPRFVKVPNEVIEDTENYDTTSINPDVVAKPFTKRVTRVTGKKINHKEVVIDLPKPFTMKEPRKKRKLEIEEPCALLGQQRITQKTLKVQLCLLCDYSVKDNKLFSMHMKAKHRVDKKYQCNQCEKVFSQYSEFTACWLIGTRC